MAANSNGEILEMPETQSSMTIKMESESYSTCKQSSSSPASNSIGNDLFRQLEITRIESVWLAAGMKTRFEKLESEIDAEIEKQEARNKSIWKWPWNWGSTSAKRARFNSQGDSNSSEQLDLEGLKDSVSTKKSNADDLIQSALALRNHSVAVVPVEQIHEIYDHLIEQDREICCLEAVANGLIKERIFDVPADLDPLVASDFWRLHNAGRNGDDETINVLLRRKGFPRTYKPVIVEHRDVTDPNYETMLLQAIRNQHFRLVKFLVNEGANLLAKNSNHSNALHLAAECGNEEIAKLVLEKAPELIGLRDEAGETAPLRALDAGHFEMARFLVQQGGETINSIAVLHEAIMNGNLPFVRILLELNPSWVESTFRGPFENEKLTPLIRAARYGFLPVVELLLSDEFKADVKAECANGFAIHYAAMEGRLQVVRYFVEKYPDMLNASNGHPTPMARSAMNGHLDVGKFLIKKGAFCFQERDARSNAFLASVRGGHIDVVDYLAERCPGVLATTDHLGNNALHIAALRGHTEVIRYFLTERPNCFNLDEHCRMTGYTALHLAVLYGHSVSAIKLLIEHGADVMAQVENITDMQSYGKTVFELEPIKFEKDTAGGDADEKIEAVVKFFKGFQRKMRPAKGTTKTPPMSKDKENRFWSA